jgi:hypothetical protein
MRWLPFFGSSLCHSNLLDKLGSLCYNSTQGSLTFLTPQYKLPKCDSPNCVWIPLIPTFCLVWCEAWCLAADLPLVHYSWGFLTVFPILFLLLCGMIVLYHMCQVV